MPSPLSSDPAAACAGAALQRSEMRDYDRVTAPRHVRIGLAQKVRSGFSVRCSGKTRTNFLGHPNIYRLGLFIDQKSLTVLLQFPSL